jgi:hypothetical protein
MGRIAVQDIIKFVSESEITKFLSDHHDAVTAWTSIFALFFSTVSIIVAVVNMRVQQRHNRKSVLPIGHISVGDYEDHIFVSVRNHGVGPMVVKKIFVAKEGDAEQERALIHFMPELPGDCLWTHFVEDISGRAIPAEEYISLVSLEGDQDDRDFVEARQLVRKVLSELSVKVEYENIYGEKMPAASRNLNWFGRHS